MKQNNIVHIIDNLGLGGAQRVVSGIFEWKQNDKNIFLFSLRKVDINMNIHHKNIFINNSKNKFSFPILKLIKFIKQNDITILHCHLAKSQIIGWILKMFFFPNIKLVFHEHGEIFEEGKIYPFLMNFFRNRVDLYIAVSSATKKEILKKTSFEEKKISVLYNFVDENKFRKIQDFDQQKERKKYGLDTHDFVVWFASRIYEGKWWKEFLNSAKIISKKYDIKFLLAGDWQDSEKLLQEIQWFSNIQYIWYIDTMTNFYNILDCFVFPSHRESLWITGIEANACETPVIASDIEWLNEIMIHGKNALLFKKQKSKELSEKILQIYQDEKLRETLIKNGVQEVKKYSLSRYLVDLEALYGNIR